MTYRAARNDLNSFRLRPMVFDRTRVIKELKILVAALLALEDVPAR